MPTAGDMQNIYSASELAHR